MPETVITAHCLQRQWYREIIRGYHGTGSKQLSEQKQHLRRPIEELPRFNDRNIEEVTQAVFEDLSYRHLDDVSVEAPVPSEDIHDPAEVEAEEIMRQAEWYFQDIETRVLHNHHTKSFLVPAYLKSMNDEFYSVKVGSCNCTSGIPCVHWVVVPDACFDSKVE